MSGSTHISRMTYHFTTHKKTVYVLLSFRYVITYKVKKILKKFFKLLKLLIN